jgi:hypothetical protein
LVQVASYLNAANVALRRDMGSARAWLERKTRLWRLVPLETEWVRQRPLEADALCKPPRAMRGFAVGTACLPQPQRWPPETISGL